MIARALFSTALWPLRTHRLRSALALGGVAVGVAAVIATQGLGRGAAREMERAVASTGTRLLVVKPLPVQRLVGRRAIQGFATTLRMEDADAAAALPAVEQVAPALEGTTRVKLGGTAMRTTVRGSPRCFGEVRNFQLESGRLFLDEEEATAQRVAILGARVATELANGTGLLGQELRIRGLPFTIVGVLAPRGSSADGADQDNYVWIPLLTAQRRVFNVPWLSNLYLTVRKTATLARAEADVARAVAARHAAGRENHPPDFSVQNTTQTRSFQQQMTDSLTRYGTALGAIALLIGAFGVAALMMVSVRERRTEIGLRIAVGAQPREVLLQFLTESVLLNIAGWTAGCAAGVLVAGVTALSTRWGFQLPWDAFLASLVSSLTVGIAFGTLPAIQAAKITPIEALLSR